MAKTKKKFLYNNVDFIVTLAIFLKSVTLFPRCHVYLSYNMLLVQMIMIICFASILQPFF